MALDFGTYVEEAAVAAEVAGFQPEAEHIRSCVGDHWCGTSVCGTDCGELDCSRCIGCP